MHSWHGKTHNFHFNGGFDGDIIIHQKDKDQDSGIRIDSEELLEFIASNYIRNILIGKIEDVNYKELFKFGLKWNHNFVVWRLLWLI